MKAKKRKLKKTINNVVNHSLERMKKLKPEDRCQLLMEVGEWIFNELDIDEELMVPQFKREGKAIEQS